MRDDTAGGYQYRYFGSFRLLLATLVMTQHFAADLAPASLADAMAPYAVGSLAVLVFFALSGFVITEAVDSVYRNRPAAFLINRMLRIVPHFLLAVFLAMLAHAFFRMAGGVRLWRSQPSFPDDAFAFSNVLMNFFAIIPSAKRLIDYDFLTITWALRVETAFYLTVFGCILVGRRLPRPRGFAIVASVLLVLTLPFFWLLIRRGGPEMLGFIPYFAFGGGLYFATTGSRAGWLTTILSVPFMGLQYVAQQAHKVTLSGIALSWLGNLIILIAVLCVMTALAFARFGRGRRLDRWLGDLTYPLYLYHEVVLIVVLTVTTGYAYGTLAIGFVLSFLSAAVLLRLVDPAVNRYRDRVRGRTLQRAAVANRGRSMV